MTTAQPFAFAFHPFRGVEGLLEPLALNVSGFLVPLDEAYKVASDGVAYDDADV